MTMLDVLIIAVIGCAAGLFLAYLLLHKFAEIDERFREACDRSEDDEPQTSVMVLK